ncbi:expressed unknown protein [Seminavis robusta]|uniref:Uncharacterized protein n=1 Tax=Seminavis robusta TaxID=568900 RepID=A0A9N8DGM7_9STRA|nr:expressed unknown protein [Seminavis robusta]|eukprot:Sro110_g054930.1 n/a (381) ;mRNA; r:69897-71308
MMRAQNAEMAEGISIRLRVRRATCTSNLQYGEPQDMVCTIVNWDNTAPRRKSGSSAPEQHSLANQFESNSSHKVDPIPFGKVAAAVTPTLFFQTRTYGGHTLEACCSLHSVSSYDSSLDPSIVSDPIETNNTDPAVGSMMTTSQRRQSLGKQQKKRRKTFSVPCCSIKTVEKMVSSLFRGYRIFFVTGSRGSYELEFENKNGMDIMMAFLQATLPVERFIQSDGTAANNTSTDGGAGDDTSYISTLDVEKLTERIAERQHTETMSEKLRKGVGQMVSSIEEMSSSFCGHVCCSSGQIMGSSVAPYVPTSDEIRDSPPSSDSHKKSRQHHLHDDFPEPVMEIDEEKSTTTTSSADPDRELKRRIYLKDHKLPSGLSVEMPE